MNHKSVLQIGFVTILAIVLSVFLKPVMASDANIQTHTDSPAYSQSKNLTMEEEAKRESTLQAVQRFSSSLEAVRRLYVDELPDDQLLENAIEGMLSRLDPHSDYLTEKEYENLDILTSGEFTGVGIEVTMENGMIRVVSPIDDTPAYKAGIKAGDMIVRINKKPVKGMTLTDAVNMIRGKAGTPVAFTVLRKGEGKPLEVKMNRNVIHLVSVKNKIIEDHYGYIRISSFQMGTPDALYDAVEKIKASSKGPLRGVVLDLRNNPGGVLPAAVDVADVFLDVNKLGHEQNVVTTKGRIADMRFEGKATTKDRLEGIPVVALINVGSASASEIVAAALQDHGRAVIMGEKSFGKGSVQTILPLPDNKTGLKLTTARFYTPAGKPIQGEGVTPDITIQHLQIPKDTKADNNALNIREDQLVRSLASEVKSVPEEDQDKKLLEQYSDAVKTDEKDLLHSDYQLHEAINLLKGLYALQKNDTPTGYTAQAPKKANKS